MSYNYTGTPLEEWQDFILWDEGCYTVPKAGQLSQHPDVLEPATISFQSPYLFSAPPSTYDGPSSYDHSISALPSLSNDSTSSAEYESYDPSPFSSAFTSPLYVQSETRYFGSFNASNAFLGSSEKPLLESPLIDTTREEDHRFDKLFGYNTWPCLQSALSRLLPDFQ